jgi:hypothetical protein
LQQQVKCIDTHTLEEEDTKLAAADKRCRKYLSISEQNSFQLNNDDEDAISPVAT